MSATSGRERRHGDEPLARERALDLAVLRVQVADPGARDAAHRHERQPVLGRAQLLQQRVAAGLADRDRAGLGGAAVRGREPEVLLEADVALLDRAGDAGADEQVDVDAVRRADEPQVVAARGGRARARAPSARGARARRRARPCRRRARARSPRRACALVGPRPRALSLRGHPAVGGVDRAGDEGSRRRWRETARRRRRPRGRRAGRAGTSRRSSRCRVSRSPPPRSRIMFSMSGVSTVPGQMQLTRIPRGARSSAIARVSETTAPFAAQ